MGANGYPLIAREGLWLILPLAAVALLLAHFAGPLAGGLTAVLVALLAIKFRDPPRRVPPVPLGIVSPVDGRVTAIEPVEDSCLTGPVLRLTLRVYPFPAYSIRTPVEGKVLEPPKGGRHGKLRRGLWLRTDEGDELILTLFGPRPGRPVSRTRYGARLGQGHRCGWLRLGSHATLDIPADSRLHVQVGDRVRSGSTVLAEFGRNGPA